MEVKLSGTALSIIVPAIISAIGGSYYLGSQTSSERVTHYKELIDEYKSSSELNAPEFLKSLNRVAKSIELSEKEKNEFAGLQIQMAEKSSQLVQCHNEVESISSTSRDNLSQCNLRNEKLQINVDELSNELAILNVKSSSFSLKSGEAQELIPNTLSVGVQDIYSNRAYVTFDNDTKNLYVGQLAVKRLDNKKCSLFLESTTSQVAKFKFSCISDA